MIPKLSRLTQRDIGKVLRKRKPFFSYHFVANVSTPHPKEGVVTPRFGIILSGKTTKGSVVRNFFRRRFYDLTRKYVDQTESIDIVVVAKKGTVLDPRNPDIVDAFDSDITHLFQKIFSKS